MSKVGILMGSKSDFDVVKPAVSVCPGISIPIGMKLWNQPAHSRDIPVTGVMAVSIIMMIPIFLADMIILKK